MNAPAPACPNCSTPAPSDWNKAQPWLCSMACFRAYWMIPEPQPQPMPGITELLDKEVIVTDRN
jgi:hypothetical protein